MQKQEKKTVQSRKSDKSPIGLSLGIGAVLGCLIIWILFMALDFCFVAFLDADPLFCTKDGFHYTGLGYSFYKYPHPKNSGIEYDFYVFGQDLTIRFND